MARTRTYELRTSTAVVVHNLMRELQNLTNAARLLVRFYEDCDYPKCKGKPVYAENAVRCNRCGRYLRPKRRS